MPSFDVRGSSLDEVEDWIPNEGAIAEQPHIARWPRRERLAQRCIALHVRQESHGVRRSRNHRVERTVLNELPREHVRLCFCLLLQTRILSASFEWLCGWPALGQLGMGDDQAFVLVLNHNIPAELTNC